MGRIESSGCFSLKKSTIMRSEFNMNLISVHRFVLYYYIDRMSHRKLYSHITAEKFCFLVKFSDPPLLALLRTKRLDGGELHYTCVSLCFGSYTLF